MTLTEIRLRLQELGVRPSRRLGQNFLYDQNLARLIVDLADIQKDQNIIEIGPGLGSLTEWLVKKQPQLTLIEKDHRFASYLRSKFPQAKVIEADALEEISNFKFKISNFLVIGNLPYSVASPLIVQLAEKDLRPARMIFTIQLEVAQRLVAQPRTPDYGLLTLLTQPFYDIKIVRKLPATVFWPQPEVSSAVVEMIRRNEPLVNPAAEISFRNLVKMAFQKRRKTLGAIFGKKLARGLDHQRRPEELSVEAWAQAAALQSVDEEYFDVVNSNDEVIGKECRGEVHRNDLLHRAIHIFIWNKKGELLLQKRSHLKDVAPNTWDSSAAGHLCVGEDYQTAAEREVFEELGINAKLTKIRKFEACKELGWEFVCLFEAKSEGPFQFPESEISELKWWSKEEIDREIRRTPESFAPSFRYIWENC